MSSPVVDHWKAVEQILCYLEGAPGDKLCMMIMVMIESRASLMWIELGQKKIRDLLQDIVYSLVGT